MEWDKRWYIRLGNRLLPAFYLHTPWWHLSIKPTKNALFSERYCYVPTWRFAGLILTLHRPSV